LGKEVFLNRDWPTVCEGGSYKAAFLKLWSTDHKWSSGSALVGPLRLNISPKRQKNKINVNCVSHTVVENLKQFAFKAYKSRAVRRT
jgi:hypothetical protein